MRITEQEHLALILQSTRDRVVRCRFGPGWIALDDSPDSEWAREWITKHRQSQATQEYASIDMNQEGSNS